jgi:hypothetical protein
MSSTADDTKGSELLSQTLVSSENGSDPGLSKTKLPWGVSIPPERHLQKKLYLLNSGKFLNPMPFMKG